MPKIRGGRFTKIIHGGQELSKAYRGSTLVFDNRVLAGTVIWSGPKAFTDSEMLKSASDSTSKAIYFVANQIVELTQPISKLKKGFTVLTKKVFTVTGAGVIETKPYLLNPPISYDCNLKDLVGNKNLLVYPAGASSNNYVSSNIYIKRVDDTHVRFLSQPVGVLSFKENSTLTLQMNNSYTFAIVDSITAY